MRRECLERFPPPPISKETDSWRSRHASRHVRDARAVMHVRIAHLRWRGKRSRHSQRMRTRNFTYLARGPWKLQVLHSYDISMLQQVGMFFDGIACLMKVWPLFKPRGSSGSSLMSRLHDALLVCDFQIWRCRCKQIDLHWFQGRQMHFWWMWSTISWTNVIIYQVRLFSTAHI